jgi:hypothetical protein
VSYCAKGEDYCSAYLPLRPSGSLLITGGRQGQEDRKEFRRRGETGEKTVITEYHIYNNM